MSNWERNNSQGSTRRSDYRRNTSSRSSGHYSKRRSYNRAPRPFIQKGADVYLLDILQHGGVDQAHHAWDPIAQILVLPDFELYEVTLNKNKISDLSLEEKYAFDIGKEALFIKVNKKLDQGDITPASEKSIPQVIRNYVVSHEERFINFLNKVGPITIKRHYLEVLPGVGKKLMHEILDQRNNSPFQNYEEVHSRVPGFRPVEVFTKRIIEELEISDLKHRLFVRRKKPNQEHQSRSRSSNYNRKYPSQNRKYR